MGTRTNWNRKENIKVGKPRLSLKNEIEYTSTDAAAVWLKEKEAKLVAEGFKPMNVILVATDSTDHTITVSIKGQKYEYWLKGNYELTEYTVRNLLKKRIYGKAIEVLKRLSFKVDKVS